MNNKYSKYTMEIQIKLNYKTQKLMKKLYGRNLGRNIAMGRKLLKMLNSVYSNHAIEKQ